MGLLTDKFFYNALSDSDEITAIVGERIFNPARPTVDEQQDRVPYIIITFDGLTNNHDTKDYEVEGEEDDVRISVLCVAKDCDALGDLTELVRATIREYYEDGDDEQTPLDWQFSAGPVNYDPDKPCCYQTLNYNCVTNR